MHGKNINLTGDNVTISSDNFNVDKDGNMSCNNASLSGNIEATTGKIGNFNIQNGQLTSDDGETGAHMNLDSYQITFSKREGSSVYSLGQLSVFDTNTYLNFVRADGNSSKFFVDEVTASVYNNYSMEELKKNFEKYTNALDVIKNIDIYKYNYKNEKDGTKKHIGFIIGDNYNYSKEITSKNNDGVDIYSFISLCCQAIKEQQEEIEELKNKIKEAD